MVTALRKQKPDKSRYRRPAKIETLLETLAGLSRDELLARVQIRSRDDAGYIPTECLVYFVRASRADNSDAWFERLYKILSARVLRALPTADAADGASRSLTRERIRTRYIGPRSAGVLNEIENETHSFAPFAYLTVRKSF